MRSIMWVFSIALAAGTSAHPQTQPPPKQPQTARQALVEMFLGRTPDAFTKHLPKLASQTLIRKGETPDTSMVQKISTIGQQLTAGGRVETFDVGTTLLVSEQDESKEKVRTEVIVERDSLSGENDEIELSIHVYRNGEPEFLPVIPRLTFSMIEENEIWKLSEATLAAHVPLTDPEYLKGVRKKEDEADEKMASIRVQVITSTEASYASQHPDRGYTCNLEDLFGKTGNVENSAQTGSEYPPASGWGASDSGAYHFSLSGCDGTPASKFQVIGAPTESDTEMKTYCADESGVVRFMVGGKSSSCLSRGQVLSKPEVSAPDPAE